MTTIPLVNGGDLLSVREEYPLVDEICRCWLCSDTADEINAYDASNSKYSSSWQSGTYYYRASDFHTRPASTR